MCGCIHLTNNTKALPMARIFSINFLFNGETETAMVTVRDTAFFTEYTLTMMNEDLEQALPGNRIIGNTSHKLFFENTGGETTALMAVILNAVEEHVVSKVI
jgi:hypothetical protein